MSQELDFEIKEELFNDKLIKFYNKYKIIINSLMSIIIITPIVIQIFFFYKNKKNEFYITEYLKAESLITLQTKKSLDILNKLSENSNNIVEILSTYRLIEYHLNQNDKKKTLELIDNLQKISNKNKFFSDLMVLKKNILNFDKINEEELLEILRDEKNIFKKLNKKLLYDYYTKNKQFDKAKQILK